MCRMAYNSNKMHTNFLLVITEPGKQIGPRFTHINVKGWEAVLPGGNLGPRLPSFGSAASNQAKLSIGLACGY